MIRKCLLLLKVKNSIEEKYNFYNEHAAINEGVMYCTVTVHDKEFYFTFPASQWLTVSPHVTENLIEVQLSIMMD